jgi:hypothetical protein
MAFDEMLGCDGVAPARTSCTSMTLALALVASDVRAVLAAIAIAAMAAAPLVAFADATHPSNATVGADPNDVVWTHIPDGVGGGG